METTITRNVNAIAADEKRTLEGMLGEALANNQQIFILAYTPGELPDDGIRTSARKRLEETIIRNQAYAEGQGISSTEADDAVAEAMSHVRRRT